MGMPLLPLTRRILPHIATINMPLPQAQFDSELQEGVNDIGLGSFNGKPWYDWFKMKSVHTSRLACDRNNELPNLSTNKVFDLGAAEQWIELTTHHTFSHICVGIVYMITMAKHTYKFLSRKIPLSTCTALSPDEGVFRGGIWRIVK